MTTTANASKRCQTGIEEITIAINEPPRDISATATLVETSQPQNLSDNESQTGPSEGFWSDIVDAEVVAARKAFIDLCGSLRAREHKK